MSPNVESYKSPIPTDRVNREYRYTRYDAASDPISSNSDDQSDLPIRRDLPFNEGMVS